MIYGLPTMLEQENGKQENHHGHTDLDLYSSATEFGIRLYMIYQGHPIPLHGPWEWTIDHPKHRRKSIRRVVSVVVSARSFRSNF